jgi:hypothetical protein
MATLHICEARQILVLLNTVSLKFCTANRSYKNTKLLPNNYLYTRMDMSKKISVWEIKI